MVDNGSTDHTQQVLERFESQNFPIQTIEEPRQGHSICRNRAIEAANGDFLIWTDDDVVVSQNWLVSYAAAFSQRPDVSFWGGPILTAAAR